MNGWGVEERYGPCMVKRNETFEIVILAEREFYKLAINGHHLGVFRHRLPLHMVQYVTVSGDASIDHVLLEQDMRSAQEQGMWPQPYPTPAAPYMPVHVTPMQPFNPPPPAYYPPQHQHHQPV